MPFERTELIYPVCDTCREPGYQASRPDEFQARRKTEYWGWRVTGGKITCPNCRSIEAEELRKQEESSLS